MYNKGQEVEGIKRTHTTVKEYHKQSVAETDLVFVYGTLRRNFGNHGLLAGAKYICDTKTKEKYLMTANGVPFVNPYIPNTQIVGEVYKITPEILVGLDILEGHPNNYFRMIIPTSNGKRCWIYFCTYGGKHTYLSGDYMKPPSNDYGLDEVDEQ